VAVSSGGPAGLGPRLFAEKPVQRAVEASVEQKFDAKLHAWARRPAILQNHHLLIRGDAREMPEKRAQCTSITRATIIR
jgi:hypothetical protein